MIKEVADLYGVKPRILAAMIYAERLLNYGWQDDALDVLLAVSGYNSSIGFCQIKLKDDRTNIHYAAVYLAMFQRRWKRAGFPISMKPEILGTLYSTGPYHTDGSERVPNPNPRYNSFGERVKQFYESDLLTHIFPK